MRKDLTAIAVVLDASGSMQSLATDTIGNFNQFLQEQKAEPGEALYTLCRFSDTFSLINDFVKLAGVPALTASTYKPHGSTALLDAMGFTIDHLGKKLSAMPETDRPSKVIVLVITDGQENASKIFTKDQIASMVKHQQDKYSWQIMFFGSSIDQISDGQSLGVASVNTIQYDASPQGTQRLYSNISNTVSTYRKSP
jgi:hypothetical protein